MTLMTRNMMVYENYEEVQEGMVGSDWWQWRGSQDDDDDGDDEADADDDDGDGDEEWDVTVMIWLNAKYMTTEKSNQNLQP